MFVKRSYRAPHSSTWYRYLDDWVRRQNKYRPRRHQRLRRCCSADDLLQHRNGGWNEIRAVNCKIHIGERKLDVKIDIDIRGANASNAWSSRVCERDDASLGQRHGNDGGRGRIGHCRSWVSQNSRVYATREACETHIGVGTNPVVIDWTAGR